MEWVVMYIKAAKTYRQLHEEKKYSTCCDYFWILF